MNEPFKPAGPEAVAKPFELLGNLFSSLGKKAGEKERRKQVFDDTVKLHKELAEVETEQHGARFQQIEAHHKAMAEIASRSSTTVGSSSTAATYRTPKPVKENANKDKDDAKETPAAETPAGKPSKVKKASSTTPPKAKKAPAPKPTPKVDKERQELNESL